MSTPNPEPQTPSPPPFHLRPAVLSDLTQIIPLQFQCFSQGILLEKIANPDTAENRQSMLERHQIHMNDPCCQVIVAVIPDYTSSTSTTATTVNKDTIVGFCMFYFPLKSEGGEVILPIPLRTPPPPPPAPAGQSESKDKVNTTAITTTTTSTATIPPLSAKTDLAQIPLSRTNISSLLPYRFSTLKRLLSTAPQGAGYVRYMSVSLSHRRHGVGRALMDWGCARFDEARVPVYLEATIGGERLYAKYGFEKVGEQVFEVYADERGEVVMEDRCACMWREGKTD